MGSERQKRLLIAGGALAGFVLLASALNTFELADGLRIQSTFADTIDRVLLEQQNDSQGEHITGELFGWIVTSVVALSVVLFILGFIKREHRASTLVLVVIGGIAALLLPRIAMGPIDPDAEAAEVLVPGAGEDAPLVGDVMDEEDAVDVTVTRDDSTGVWSWALGIVAFGVLLVIVRPQLPQLRKRDEPSESLELGDATREAIESVSAGTDVLAAVIRYYREVVELYWNRRFKGRVGSITPRELATRLIEAGVPANAAFGLTELFERARYGEIVLSTEEEAEAVGYLRSIQEAMANRDD